MTQPTALFLADILEDAGKPVDIAEKCAAELRRLHADQQSPRRHQGSRGEHMTRAIKLLAALLIPSVLVWLSVGFVLWNWNPETWAEGARFIFVGFSFVLTIPAVVIFGDIA